MVSADGGPARQLTVGALTITTRRGRRTASGWPSSPPATRTRDEDGAADIFTVPVGGGEPRRLTRTEGPVSWPAFSPDGRTVAYVGHSDPRGVSRHHRLYTVPADGGSPVCLTAAFDRNCEPLTGAGGPQWLGRTGALLFQVEDEGNVALYRVAAAGGGAPERLIGGTRQVTAFSASRDGALIAFAATDDTSPPEIFVCRADGTGERQLTDLNREWKAEVARARPERFRFERAGFSDRRLGDAAVRAGGGPALPGAAQHPRRARQRSTATASSTSSRCTRARATPSST